jgi:membrane-associated phospholipid phosphatase
MKSNSRAERRLGRRSFLGTAAAAAVAATTLPELELSVSAKLKRMVTKTARGSLAVANRLKPAYAARIAAANLARSRPLVDNRPNGDEEAMPTFVGSYSKGMPHNKLGEVDPAAYNKLLAALKSGKPQDFESIPIAQGLRLENPQAGLCFQLQGADSHHTYMRPAPAFSSAETASEMAENYWHALTRDVPFEEFDTNPLIAAAAADLSRFSDFRGPKAGGKVTPATIFRGSTPDDLAGPFISQFLLNDTPYGPQRISSRIRVFHPGVDHLTNYVNWLGIQNGVPPRTLEFDPTMRYIRNQRDLTRMVQNDALFQLPINAALQLMAYIRAPLDTNLPSRSSGNQTGFVEFGGPFLLSLVASSCVPALRAVWYHKWWIHRKIRPEELGGRIHNHMTGAAKYPLHAELLDSPALAATFSKYGTYLLPQAYPEGCPTHPSYGSGHAAFMGAAVTMIKACFDESHVIGSPVVPTSDGSALVPYTGNVALTVGGELNKLAANVAIGRNMAGIHYRSDGNDGLLLGEAVAIAILEEEKGCYNQDFEFKLTKFDGTSITI